ncbi:uncharacterized protein PHACADRAFT_92809 [Phanerochaete carnosa HHB-10118-sp]|uniref:Uncharacterized protein n=1 Tax=Phanerochaete carnosa (strain HHB-10118-sp) TaxID=650164 RepID=K5VXE2_PHACS|nr:uncharacterized protein PHACADRAFT_92809 [Phanerochaete carnosa HHB-10118-sp]EKM56243.1 hypothetical protein PHACADRAFT_92809 [Phanerochaete carnosa HHB-10118-sp]
MVSGRAAGVHGIGQELWAKRGFRPFQVKRLGWIWYRSPLCSRIFDCPCGRKSWSGARVLPYVSGNVHRRPPLLVDHPRFAPRALVGPRPSVSSSLSPLQDPQDAATLEASYRRTIIIVYWYKAGMEPVRMTREVPTFPLFRLSNFKDITESLALSNNSFIDAYDPESQTWSQQPTTAVQTIKHLPNQLPRLLFRARKSLLEGLSDHECSGLDHELRIQHHAHHANGQSPTLDASSPPTRPAKRPAPDGAGEPMAKHFRTPSTGFVHSGTHTPAFATNMSAQQQQQQPGPSAPMNPSPTSPSLQSPFLQRDDALQPASDDALVGGAQGQPGAAPGGSGGGAGGGASPTGPPGKRWPNDYAVCEIAQGFQQMDKLTAATPSLTQRAAFERVFGCRYVKSTVCRHRGVWKRADGALKDAFVRMGTGEGALWGEFVKKTDFRREHHKVKGQDEDGLDAHVQIDYMGSLGLGMVDEPPPPMASLAPPG